MLPIPYLIKMTNGEKMFSILMIPHTGALLTLLLGLGLLGLLLRAACAPISGHH